MGRERFELIEAWRYLPQFPLFFGFLCKFVFFLSVLRIVKKISSFTEFFDSEKCLCVFVCAGPVQKSIDGGFIFVEICLNQGDFTHECREFMICLCSLIYSIHMNVVNTIHYVVKTSIHDIFVFSLICWRI